ncbi:DC1L2-like protein, partial [Mya arenaria]
MGRVGHRAHGSGNNTSSRGITTAMGTVGHRAHGSGNNTSSRGITTARGGVGHRAHGSGNNTSSRGITTARGGVGHRTHGSARGGVGHRAHGSGNNTSSRGITTAMGTVGHRAHGSERVVIVIFVSSRPFLEVHCFGHPSSTCRSQTSSYRPTSNTGLSLRLGGAVHVKLKKSRQRASRCLRIKLYEKKTHSQSLFMMTLTLPEYRKNPDTVKYRKPCTATKNSILTEVQSSSASKLPTSKSVIVLDQGRLGMWALDGDTMHTSLLKYALTEETFENTLVLLVASMTSPWSILDTLEKWASILRHHIDRLRISPEDRRDYDQSLVRFYQEYVEPDESTSVTQTSMRRDVNPLHPAAPAVAEEDKADAISTLEKENDYKEEHFDFIQMHIRNFCLHYGASLFYTSVKEEKNCDLLHQYLLHRIYGFPFNMPAFVVEKDSWDNDKKIAILHENLQNIKPTDAYEDVIAKPIVRKPVQRDAEVTVEDVQLFLMKQQSHLSKAPSPGAAGESPVRTGSQTPKTATIGKAASSPTPTTKLVNAPTDQNSLIMLFFLIRVLVCFISQLTLHLHVIKLYIIVSISFAYIHCRGACRARENDKDHGKNYKKSPFRCQPKWTNRLLIGSFLTMYVMVSFLKRREKTATLCIIMIWGIFAACAVSAFMVMIHVSRINNNIFNVFCLNLEAKFKNKSDI